MTRATVVALIAVTFAAGVLMTCALEGCRSALPEEPAFVETVAANVRDR